MKTFDTVLAVYLMLSEWTGDLERPNLRQCVTTNKPTRKSKTDFYRFLLKHEVSERHLLLETKHGSAQH